MNLARSLAVFGQRAQNKYVSRLRCLSASRCRNATTRCRNASMEEKAIVFLHKRTAHNTPCIRIMKPMLELSCLDQRVVEAARGRGGRRLNQMVPQFTLSPDINSTTCLPPPLPHRCPLPNLLQWLLASTLPPLAQQRSDSPSEAMAMPPTTSTKPRPSLLWSKTLAWPRSSPWKRRSSTRNSSLLVPPLN